MSDVEKIKQIIKNKATELKNDHWHEDVNHLTGKGIECMCVQTLKILDEELEKEQECEWKKNDDEGYYETSCDNLITLIDGTPKENKWGFCPYCNGKIKVIE